MAAWIFTIIHTLRKAFTVLRTNDPLILASSTAFFATFALSPIIVILVTVFGLYSGSGTFTNQLFRTVGSTVGTEAAREIESIVYNFKAIDRNIWITLGGSVFLIFIATTLLGVIKSAIHKVWHIKPATELKLTYHSRERGTGLGFLLFTSLLFMVYFIVDSMMAVSMDYLIVTWPSLLIRIMNVLNGVFLLIIVTFWFSVIFKWLPDARISWDVAFSGGLLTGLLFSIGKFLLGKTLVYSRMETIFGASASFALLLLFIFYCSLILYFGASFTHAYGETIKDPIYPAKYAHEYEEKIIKKDALQEI